MSCTPLPKAAKPVWAKQLTRLPCLVLYVKLQFVYIGGHAVLAKDHFYLFLGRTQFYCNNLVVWPHCHVFCHSLPHNLHVHPETVKLWSFSKSHRKQSSFFKFLQLSGNNGRSNFGLFSNNSVISYCHFVFERSCNKMPWAAPVGIIGQLCPRLLPTI